jgi:5-amino-6-(5-phosphoribosylamino)uracil reductase/diaminohydroxyphosphoribosylaminopyrimidine deaminase/5-amino-6-(5-phosphoribosylamino)uracil reductase
MQPQPIVTLHFAQSLDGRISLENQRLRLSSDEGLLRAQRARAENDAVLVGVRTIEIDDPRLTLRATPGAQPRRVVLSSTLRLPESARLFEPVGADAGEIVVIGARGRAESAHEAMLARRGARALVVDASEGWVAPEAALAALAQLGVKRVLVEGGARVLSSFLRHRLAAHAFVEIAPTFLGSPATSTLLSLGGVRATLGRVQVETIEGHVFVRGDIEYA